MSTEPKGKLLSNWAETFKLEVDTPQSAVKRVQPGHRVFLSTGCSQPLDLVRALTDRGKELTDVEIIQIFTHGEAPYASEEYSKNFRYNSFFVTDNLREEIRKAPGSYTPILLSSLPSLIKGGQIPFDVALVQISPPDERGMCSLGISVDIVKCAVENAEIVIAQVNPNMPWTYGDSLVSIYDIDVLVPSETPLVEVGLSEITEEYRKIGENVAGLVEDGSTLQLGFGNLPQIIMAFLKGKKDLGIHSEMISNRIVDLVESGAVNGRRKSKDQGKIVTSFAVGDRKLYDYLDKNPAFSFRATEYVNDTEVISRQHKMVAINTALEVDLTGQVCAGSLGTKFYSGIGGLADFSRGALRSIEGKAIIALPATAINGETSRIVGQLTPGAGVVITRGDVQYIVTEYGVAYLYGKSIQERAMALISIAHPKYRAELLKQAIEYRYVVPEMADAEGTLVVKPKALRTTQLLPDGTQIHFRSIHPTDEPSMRDLFYKLSEATLYYRFGWSKKKFPIKQIKEFMFVDHRDEVSIVGTVPSPKGDEIIAFGGYSLDRKTNRAEVALVVLDEWQGNSIGSFMIKYLARIAQQEGISGFTSEIHFTNKSMQALMNKAGKKVHSDLNDTIFSLKTDF